MTVRDLMEILSGVDPDLPIATHANNHTTFPGDRMRVGVFEWGLSGGRHKTAVLLGNWIQWNIDGWNQCANGPRLAQDHTPPGHAHTHARP